MPAFLPSELPVRATARQHWIVLLRRPRKSTVIVLTVLLVVSWIWPARVAWLLVLVAAFLASQRWREWRAERVLLTGKRIIHVQGTVETTASENSLRIDRVSGVRYIETVAGKVLGFATIELEAPGNHPGVSRLRRLSDPERFYLELRDVVYGEDGGRDPDEEGYLDPSGHVTAPLPAAGGEAERPRRGWDPGRGPGHGSGPRSGSDWGSWGE